MGHVINPGLLESLWRHLASALRDCLAVAPTPSTCDPIKDAAQALLAP
jgi:hypothetical protein